MVKCILLLVLYIFSVSCQSLKSGLKSSWQVLQEAESTSCEKWPKRSHDLEITGIDPIVIDRPGFVVEARTRKGLKEAYFVPFSGDSVDVEKSMNLRWGSHARYLGHFSFEGVDHIVLEVVDSKGIKFIEVREPKSNVIKFKASTKMRRFHGLRVFNGPNGFWITYKVHDPKMSIDEADNFIILAEINDKAQLTLKQQNQFKPKGDIQAVEMMDRKLMVFVFEPDAKKNGAGKITYTLLDGSGKKPLIYAVGKEVLERVESWTINRHRDGALLVFISGDTLIWENAKLEIYSIDSLGDILWSKSFPIEHEHVGDPLLVSSALENYLLLPKWLDSESTIEILGITASDVKSKGYHGIYKEGTYAGWTYFDSKKGNLFVINQFPDGFIKSQAICEVDL